MYGLLNILYVIPIDIYTNNTRYGLLIKAVIYNKTKFMHNVPGPSRHAWTPLTYLSQSKYVMMYKCRIYLNAWIT